MGRSKTNRPQPKPDGSPRPLVAHKDSCKCRNCTEMFAQQYKAFGHHGTSDFEQAIAYHWTTLTPESKQFLIDDPEKFFTDNPERVNLIELVKFWSVKADLLESGKLSSSMCGASWYLALNYLGMGKVAECKALILNGAFLQQCYKSSISCIAKVVEEHQGRLSAEVLQEKLPYFRAALNAVVSRERMENYLKKALPPNYQRMMNFASKSAHGPVTEYVDLISDDWNNSAGSGSRDRNGRGRAGRKGDKAIEIRLVDSDCGDERKMEIGSSDTLRTLFNEYAEERGISLRSLRFSHQGSTLFLSSAGNKTSTQLGMDNLSIIHVTCITAASSSSSDESTTQSRRSRKSKGFRGNKRGKGKSKQTQPQKITNNAQLALHTPDEEIKILHSKALSLIFEEAEPKFREIRQGLNAMNIERSLPKSRTRNTKPARGDDQPVNSNPPTEGLGGKAGKSVYIVQVGEVENLYKTSKPSTRGNRASKKTNTQKYTSIDLHGLTREEAIESLDASLPEWNDMAMKGSYPWVLPVEIVCGGGSQILSEAVEGWIKANDKVANAPKNLFVPQRNTPYPYAA